MMGYYGNDLSTVSQASWYRTREEIVDGIKQCAKFDTVAIETLKLRDHIMIMIHIETIYKSLLNV